LRIDDENNKKQNQKCTEPIYNTSICLNEKQNKNLSSKWNEFICVVDDGPMHYSESKFNLKF